MNGLAKRPNSTFLIVSWSRYRDERAATDTSYIISLPCPVGEERIARAQKKREKEKKRKNEIKGGSSSKRRRVEKYGRRFVIRCSCIERFNSRRGRAMRRVHVVAISHDVTSYVSNGVDRCFRPSF